jgi:glycosyltransferase involved in cell wall biosynthesis
MDRLPAPVHRALAGLLEVLAVAWLVSLAVIERPRTWARRRRGLRPRLIWGPVPLISLKYWSEAMRRAGYTSRTCVTNVYSLYRREDFDVYLDRFGTEGRFPAFAQYRFFAWTLLHGDLFFRFLDGGFLRHTRLQWWEARLLKLAGKRLIVSPYGGDVAVSGHLGGLEEELYADYPHLREQNDEIERWVEHTTKFADLVIRNWQIGYLPRYDVVWLSQLAIDLARWRLSETDSGSNGRDGPVSVLHAPNHRRIKGTTLLERAVEALRAEGLEIELRLLEGVPNEELRAAMESADVVADQFLLPGYAMAAVEAMSLGRPVMDNLGDLPPEVRATEAFRECPAVDTSRENLEGQLRRLVQDPALRRELGLAGREFVECFHSYEAVSQVWTEIIDHVWWGTPLPESLAPAR